MNRFFPEGSYQTPPDTKRDLMDKLFLGSRFYLMARFLYQGQLSKNKVLRGEYSMQAWADSSFHIFKSVERCGGRFSIKGLDYLNELEGPVVFVANHMSTLEAITLPAMIAPFLDATFVVKDSLIRAPILGKVIEGTDPIVVNRVNPREDLQKVLTEGADNLKRGISVVIFPQSTRSLTFDREAFNSLGVKLAKRANVPVLPIALKTDFWENGKIIKDLGPVFRDRVIHFAFGKPIPVEGNGKEAHQECISFIEAHLAQWGVPIKEMQKPEGD